MRIVLCGPKGVGKTTLGRELAEIKHWPFFDLDDRLKDLYNQRNNTKLTVPEIFRALGEDAFRDLETTVVLALDLPESCVLATGGGAVLAEENRHALRKLGQVVYLEPDNELLARRYLSGKKPAYINQNQEKGLAEFLSLCQDRHDSYLQAAHHRIAINMSDVHLAIMQLETLGESCGQ